MSSVVGWWLFFFRVAIYGSLGMILALGAQGMIYGCFLAGTGIRF